jgi:hypothetical protein
VLILLDNNAPRGIARALTSHTVTEARERGWATLKNGDLLTAAEDAGFQVLVTSDKSIRYQQNLEGRKIAAALNSRPRLSSRAKLDAFLTTKAGSRRRCRSCRCAAACQD